MSFAEIPNIFVNILRENLSAFVWQELYRRPKRIVPIDISESTLPFWERVISEAASVGPEPMVLVPFDPIGEEVSMASMQHQGLGGFYLSREAGLPTGGGGTGYLASIEGIPVYAARILGMQAILCSRLMIRTIDYGGVDGKDEIVDFTFVDGEDAEKSQVRIQIAQRVNWSDDVFVEFELRVSSSQDGESSGDNL
jgi:hypothetical protein